MHLTNVQLTVLTVDCEGAMLAAAKRRSTFVNELNRSKFEIGDRSLHIADLIQICRALNASPVRLLKEAIEKSYTI